MGGLLRQAAFLGPLMVPLVVSACVSQGPTILSTYGSTLAVDGSTGRRAPHTGVDFGDLRGAPVLAAADGEVVGLSDERNAECGIGIILSHSPFPYYTVYCHLERHAVSAAQKIKRGEVIGFVGTTGNALNIPHVHFGLGRFHPGRELGTDDPLTFLVGCFDFPKPYPTDRLVLTYPVRCTAKKEERQ